MNQLDVEAEVKRQMSLVKDSQVMTSYWLFSHLKARGPTIRET